ncbi:MAG: DUF1805 domain-containing protein [Desulfurococcales archaeon]|nr:DUF1805 domain-containing protein [Desulfurococcales archaeon]
MEIPSVNNIVRVKNIVVDGKKLIGLEVDLPGAPLVLIRGDKGFIMCGYLNIEVTNKLGIIAAKVSGVKTVEDVLKSSIKAVSLEAEKAGIKIGVKVKDVLDKI